MSDVQARRSFKLVEFGGPLQEVTEVKRVSQEELHLVAPDQTYDDRTRLGHTLRAP